MPSSTPERFRENFKYWGRHHLVYQSGYRLFIDGYQCDQQSLFGGLGDKSKELTTDKCNPATPGPHTIQVVADSTFEVDESDEGNNTATEVFLWYDPDACGATELCNGVDDTCNGEVDETFYQLGQPCDGPDDDLCEQGVYVCSDSGQGVECEEPVGPIPELCNGVDDDCNGDTRMRGSKRLASPAVSKQMGALWRVFGHTIPLV